MHNLVLPVELVRCPADGSWPRAKAEHARGRIWPVHAEIACPRGNLSRR
jgi:hypothetical protein